MTAGSAAAFWYGMAPNKAKPKIMEHVGQRLAKRYATYKEELMQAAGLENATPDERLAAYQARSPQTWRLLETVWPDQKKKQAQDWQQLETTSLNKRLVSHLTRDQIPPGLKA